MDLERSTAFRPTLRHQPPSFASFRQKTAQPVRQKAHQHHLPRVISPASPQLMPATVAPAAVRRRILLLLLLGVDRPDDLVLPPVVQAFEVVLPGRVAD